MAKVLVSGVVGYPVQHSLSPEIFRWIAKRLETPVIYEKIEIPPHEFRSQIRVLKNSNLLSGLNVTIPHKEIMLGELDEVSPEVNEIGAVNVIQVQQGKWKGFNTDVIGVTETFREHQVKLKGKSAMIFGAGGAARSVGYVLGQFGAKKVYIANRKFSRAQKLVQEYGRRFPQTEFKMLSRKELQKWEEPLSLYVNATPLGMAGFDERVALPKQMQEGAFAFDVVYRPEITPFLRIAQKNGLQTIGGLDMLIWQALGAWKIWMGRIPTQLKFKNDLKKYLRKKLEKYEF